MSPIKKLLEARPLSPAHWSLPVLIVLAWMILTTAFQCRRHPEGLIEAFLSGLVLVALWVNHLSVAPVSGVAGIARLIGGAMLDLIKLVICWFVVMLPLLVFLPAYQCYNDRAVVAEWFVATAPTRDIITNRIQTNRSVNGSGTGLRLDLGKRAVSGRVLDSGHIAMVGKEPTAALVLVPTWADGTVTWTCFGTPEKLVPMTCRSGQETATKSP